MICQFYGTPSTSKSRIGNRIIKVRENGEKIIKLTKKNNDLKQTDVVILIQKAFLKVILQGRVGNGINKVCKNGKTNNKW